MYRFTVLGRDPRWEMLAELLEKKGPVQREWPGPAPEEEAEAVVFPFGAAEEEVLRALVAMKPGTRVFLWEASPAQRSLAAQRGLGLYSCGEDRILRAQNALGTAEGTLASVLALRDRTLFGETVLVCGFGHCGSAIARLFWLCGCEVYVFARARGLGLAQAEGFATLSSLFSQQSARFRLVINTIPAPIFTRDLLGHFAPGTEILQVASGLSGIDPEFCQSRGIGFHPLPGLPGRFSPRSEAQALEEFILERCGEGKPWL